MLRFLLKKNSQYLDAKSNQDNFSKLSVNHTIMETKHKPIKVKEQWNKTLWYEIKIQCILSCSHGCLPFTYLGVSIFVGAPRGRFLQLLVDKVKLKLASWKAKSLSMMSRVQLVNTVITGLLAYSFNLYK